MEQAYHTADIKLASILVALGVKRRQSDPITCMVQERDGKRHQQFTFWLDVSTDETFKKCANLVEAYYKFRNEDNMILDEDHPLYYMMAAFFNREKQLDEMKSDVEPMRTIKKGGVTLIIPENPSEALKQKLKKL